MAYVLDNFEKWKVFIKPEGPKTDNKFNDSGQEMGITDKYAFDDCDENILSNTKINLMDNTMNKEFYDDVRDLNGKHINMSFVGLKSKKVLQISGYFNMYIEIEGYKRNIRYTIKNGSGKEQHTIGFKITKLDTK